MISLFKVVAKFLLVLEKNIWCPRTCNNYNNKRKEGVGVRKNNNIYYRNYRTVQ